MASITDNPPEPARDRSDEEWARWEQTFRDARPVLPDAAMARIEAAIQREADGAAAAAHSRLRRRISLLLTAAIAIIGVVWLVLFLRHYRHEAVAPKPPGPAPAARVQGQYPLEVLIGPQLAAPDRPIIALAENWKWISSDQPLEPAAPPVRRTEIPGLVKGARQLFEASPDGWRGMGLMEISRAANVSQPLPAPVEPHVGEFRELALWRMLEEPNLDAFSRQSREPGIVGATADEQYWNQVFTFVRAWHARDAGAVASLDLPELPHAFPSQTGNKARFEMLTELGMLPAQAGLDVLTTRSYDALRTLRAAESWDAATRLRAKLHAGYLAASHDLVERLFALRMLERTREADELIARAEALPYLLHSHDLALHMARLGGPINVWEKFVRPLMEDEVGFIEHPPEFSYVHPHSDVMIEASARSEATGAMTYSGRVMLTVGSWRIGCNTLTVVNANGRAAQFKCSGGVDVRGIIGLISATSDEATLDAESGELQLTGRVHLEEWGGGRDTRSSKISRAGKVE